MGMLLCRLQKLSFHPCAGWVVISLANAALIHKDYGTNQESRFAALWAMVEDRALRIDHYKDLPIDWARLGCDQGADSPAEGYEQYEHL
jgi:hypothetical protein